MYDWLKNSADIIKFFGKIAAKSKSLRSIKHPVLENALMKYLGCVIITMNGSSIMREDFLRQKALKICNSIWLELENKKLNLFVKDDSKKTLSKKNLSLLDFKGSSRWFYYFKERKFLKSIKPRGKLHLLNKEDI